MSQYSYAARDILPSPDANNGTQLSFDNVIVLFPDFDVYPDPGGSGYDRQKVDYTFGGVGYYFNGGKDVYKRQPFIVLLFPIIYFFRANVQFG